MLIRRRWLGDDYHAVEQRRRGQNTLRSDDNRSAVLPLC